jgi:hypothetical protein
VSQPSSSSFSPQIEAKLVHQWFSGKNEPSLADVSTRYVNAAGIITEVTRPAIVDDAVPDSYLHLQP